LSMKGEKVWVQSVTIRCTLHYQNIEFSLFQPEMVWAIHKFSNRS
jgi:hypothetical protein